MPFQRQNITWPTLKQKENLELHKYNRKNYVHFITTTLFIANYILRTARKLLTRLAKLDFGLPHYNIYIYFLILRRTVGKVCAPNLWTFKSVISAYFALNSKIINLCYY